MQIEVIQGISKPTDVPTEIYFGDEYGKAKPTAYYSVRHDSPTMRCVLWCFFHRKDWSKTGGIIGKLDSHEFDFEGALQYIPLTNRVYDKDRPFIWACVAHHDINWYETFSDQLRIDDQGHPISVGIEPPRGDKYLRLDFDSHLCGIDDYEAIPMDEPKMMAFLRGDVQRIFNDRKYRVNLPWQWGDWLMAKKYGKKRTVGLMWDDPLLLLDLARKGSWISRKVYNRMIGGTK